MHDLIQAVCVGLGALLALGTFAFLFSKIKGS